jgi:sialic acid synthase SpsE
VVSSELAQLVEGARFIEAARSCRIDKEQVGPDLLQLRKTFTKSLFATCDIAAGTRLELKHLVAKKPGTGIPATDVHQIIGRLAITNVRAGEMIKLSDIESRSDESG